MEKKNAKTMPYSLEAEQSLLGCILIDASIAAELMAKFKKEDFYSKAHELIFEAMTGLNKSAKPIDLVTLSDALDGAGNLSAAGGVEYLTVIMQAVPGTTNYRHYEEIVKRDSLRRKIVAAADKITDKAVSVDNENEVLAFAEKSIYDISVSQDTSSLVSMSESFADIIVRFNKIQSDRNAFRGLMTGFTDLDRMTNGLQKSDLVLIAARPSVGKTSFACNIIENISVLGGGVSAVFSLEMSKLQLAQRMICSVANVSMEKALKGNLDKKDWEEIWKAHELVSRAKVFVDDSALITPREMLSKCRRMQSVHGLDVVMIDYIQLMQGDVKSKDGNRQQEVSAISRDLKIMAKELNVPVIALSQLSREAEKEAKPQLSHLRESGAIEQDADIVMFIHRPDKIAKNEEDVKSGKILKDVAEIIVAKHRNGPTDTISLKWIGEMTKFVNMNRDDTNLERTYNLNKEAEKAHVAERQARAAAAQEEKIVSPPQTPAGIQPADTDVRTDFSDLSSLEAPPFDMGGEYIDANKDDMFE